MSTRIYNREPGQNFISPYGHKLPNHLKAPLVKPEVSFFSRVYFGRELIGKCTR